MSGNSHAAGRSAGTLRLFAGAGAGALVLATAFAAPASAAAPHNRGCLGNDISRYAQMGAGFGAFVKSLAEDGVGDEIQAHLAGDAPIPNTCSD